MGLQRKELEIIKYKYDFAVDGGAVSSIAMRAEVNPLEEDCLIVDFDLHIATLITSGGTPTLTLGDGTDADGYLVDFAGTLTADTIVNRGALAGALVWDDTNDHPIHHRIGSAAADIEVNLAVGTAALTAGAIDLYFHVLRLAR